MGSSGSSFEVWHDQPLDRPAWTEGVGPRTGERGTRPRSARPARPRGPRAGGPRGAPARRVDARSGPAASSPLPLVPERAHALPGPLTPFVVPGPAITAGRRPAARAAPQRPARSGAAPSGPRDSAPGGVSGTGRRRDTPAGLRGGRPDRPAAQGAAFHRDGGARRGAARREPGGEGGAPVAEVLAGRGVPLASLTGHDAGAIPERPRMCPVPREPCRARQGRAGGARSSNRGSSSLPGRARSPRTACLDRARSRPSPAAVAPGSDSRKRSCDLAALGPSHRSTSGRAGKAQ